MIEHTMLVSVEDAVSMSRKRADGLAELCRGMIDSGSGDGQLLGHHQRRALCDQGRPYRGGGDARRAAQGLLGARR